LEKRWNLNSSWFHHVPPNAIIYGCKDGGKNAMPRKAIKLGALQVSRLTIGTIVGIDERPSIAHRADAEQSRRKASGMLRILRNHMGVGKCTRSTLPLC
jgi:hypothetical protein